MADDRWWNDLDAVVAAMLPRGSRILDLGCGDGALVDRLAELGFDPIGVDPRAPAHPSDPSTSRARTGPRRIRRDHRHDGAAPRSAPDVLQAINEHLRPGGRLFVSEFGWDAYDERAVAWLADHHPPAADNSIAGWQREHRELHTWTTVRDALSNHFTPTLEVDRPYLARMLRRRDLEADEHALIDAQLLPALGIWYIANRD
jgi:SAM-dependent methyltransferase